MHCSRAISWDWQHGPLEYVASLVDMDKINEFAWDGHFLAAALKEVKKYQKKREAGKSGFWIGGCPPMFTVCQMILLLLSVFFLLLFAPVSFFCRSFAHNGILIVFR